LHLFGSPNSLDLDDKPGADGFVVTIYASSHAEARGTRIKSGTIEILMFDGMAHYQDGTPKEPSRTWTFTAKQLESYARNSAIGMGYQFALRWEQAVPRQDRITVIARLLPPQGPAISSSEGTISVVAR
jgi:hypothetical protein